MRSFFPAPSQPLALPPTAPHLTGPRGTPSCSWLDPGVDEVGSEWGEGGQTGEVVMEIRRYGMEDTATGMVCFLHRPHRCLELWF